MIRKDRTTEPRSVPGGPPFDRAKLTQDGRRLLEERIQSLERTVAELHSALDESERSADTVESHHQAARELDHLRSLLTSAEAIEDIPDDPRVVELGDTVTIRLDDGAEETYIVVHPAEAPVEDQRISAESPLGDALLARQVGETIEVPGPAGSYRCEILRATRRL
jgi:transcription elongation factor GreA